VDLVPDPLLLRKSGSAGSRTRGLWICIQKLWSLDHRGGTCTYQPNNNLVKDENGDLVADSHNILNRWKNYFSQLLNVHNVSDVKLIEVHMAQPLVPGPSRLDVGLLLQSWKSINRQAVMKFWQNWFKQEAKYEYYCLRSTNSLILFGVRRNCLISGRSLLLQQFTKKGDKIQSNNNLLSNVINFIHNLSNILISRFCLYIN
jgi:hypothetical protein